MPEREISPVGDRAQPRQSDTGLKKEIEWIERNIVVELDRGAIRTKTTEKGLLINGKELWGYGYEAPPTAKALAKFIADVVEILLESQS